MESVQRYFTRRINRIKALTYKERLFILNIESLEVRRIKRDLVMCYKIVNNLIDLQCESFFKFSSISTRGHSFKIVKPPLVKNNLALNLLQYRVVEYWNWLPDYVVTSSSLNVFKSNLDSCNFNELIKGRTFSGLANPCPKPYSSANFVQRFCSLNKTYFNFIFQEIFISKVSSAIVINSLHNSCARLLVPSVQS